MSIAIQSNSPLRSVPADYCPADSDQWYVIPHGLDAGKKLFYMDYQPEDREPEKTVLFVHGNPECSYTYRYVRQALQQADAPLRIVCPDHIGFGISDQADFQMVDMHHAENLRMLIEHLDLRHVILVVHDWGGPIGVGAFLDQMDRVDGLVVLNSTLFPMPSDGYTYDAWPSRMLPWSRLGWLIPGPLWGGAAASALEGANPGPVGRLYGRSVLKQLRFALRRIPEGTPAYVFSESLRSRSNAKSSQRHVRQTPVWGHGYVYYDKKQGRQDNRRFYRAIQQQLPACWGRDGANIPVAAHFGEFDPCGKPSVRQQWLIALPRLEAALHVYPDIGHFVEEYKGPEIAQSILSVAGTDG